MREAPPPRRRRHLPLPRRRNRLRQRLGLRRHLDQVPARRPRIWRPARTRHPRVGRRRDQRARLPPHPRAPAHPGALTRLPL